MLNGFPTPHGLTYIWALGEEAAERLMQRVNRTTSRATRSGTFMTLLKCTAELIYQKAPGDDGYREYWLLYMPAEREQANEIYCESDLRERAIKELSDGSARVH